MTGRPPEALHQVALSTKVIVGAIIVISNVVGATLLVGLAVYVLPFGALVDDASRAIRVNLVLLAVYAPLAGLAAFAAGWSWLRVPAPPGP